MRPACTLLAAGSLLLALPSLAQTNTDAPLPLARVRLYETGVGYFERTGVVPGGDRSALPVPAGHLDDALKTLVVMSEDGGTEIDGIEFASSVSRDMGIALAGMTPDQDGKIDYAHLLTSLEGAPVEIRVSGGTYSGRLVDVEDPPAGGHRLCEQQRSAAGEMEEVCTTSNHRTLLLLTDRTEIKRFRSTEVLSLRPTDPAWQARIGSTLDALSQRGAQSARKLRLLGKSAGPVTVGYIAETPVWRSTYRLVLAEQESDDDVLQGWALLHNDTDEDWKKVKVELVNGRPDSFLFPLAAPRYARRDLVTPENELSTVPQLLDQTVDNMWLGDSFGVGGLGLSGVGEGGGGYASGIGLGSVGTIGHGGGAGHGVDSQSGLLAVGNLASLAQAEGVESGALFQYALRRPIDLRAHGSALLPFLTQKLKVERIAYVAHPGATARTGVQLHNSGRQTLPAGPISVFSDGGFAGESALTRTKPGERRILQFGTDLDIELDEVGHVTSDEPRVLTYQDGRMTLHFVRHHTVTYALANRGGRARKLLLPLSYVSNADVKGTDGLTFDEEQRQPIAVFDSPPNKQSRRVIEVREGLSRLIPWQEDAGREELWKLAKADSLSAEQRKIVDKAHALHQDKLSRSKSIRHDQAKLKIAKTDLGRLRANVAALRGHDDADAMVAKMLAAEERVDELRKSIEEQKKKRAGIDLQVLRALEGLETTAP